MAKWISLITMVSLMTAGRLTAHVGLVWWLVATLCQACIPQMKQINFCNDCHDDSTIYTVLNLWLPTAFAWEVMQSPLSVCLFPLYLWKRLTVDLCTRVGHDHGTWGHVGSRLKVNSRSKVNMWLVRPRVRAVGYDMTPFYYCEPRATVSRWLASHVW